MSATAMTENIEEQQLPESAPSVPSAESELSSAESAPSVSATESAPSQVVEDDDAQQEPSADALPRSDSSTVVEVKSPTKSKRTRTAKQMQALKDARERLKQKREDEKRAKTLAAEAEREALDAVREENESLRAELERLKPGEATPVVEDDKQHAYRDETEERPQVERGATGSDADTRITKRMLMRSLGF